MTPRQYTEDQLVEQPAIKLFEELGWESVNAFQETLGPNSTLGRDNKSEVFLTRRLRAAIERLNPGTPGEAIDQAVTEITRPRTVTHYARANQQIHSLMRDRVEVSVRQPDGTTLPEKLAVIDWENPENNDFLVTSQLWVHSDLYHRRTDLIGFVNGIPLVFIELKASHRNLKHAYDDNLRDYRDSIPHLFAPNGFLVLSNGADTKVGTITSGWEFFSEWKKINSEGEEGSVSLETVIRGMCTKERLLDLIENFVAFQDLPVASSNYLRVTISTSGLTTQWLGWTSYSRHLQMSGAGLACSGTRRVPERPSRCSSSPRRSCASGPATGRLSSSPTATTSMSRPTRSSSMPA